MNTKKWVSHIHSPIEMEKFTIFVTGCPWDDQRTLIKYQCRWLCFWRKQCNKNSIHNSNISLKWWIKSFCYQYNIYLQHAFFFQVTLRIVLLANMPFHSTNSMECWMLWKVSSLLCCISLSMGVLIYFHNINLQFLWNVYFCISWCQVILALGKQLSYKPIITLTYHGAWIDSMESIRPFCHICDHHSSFRDHK